jgi:hypothetical protein
MLVGFVSLTVLAGQSCLMCQQSIHVIIHGLLLCAWLLLKLQRLSILAGQPSRLIMWLEVHRIAYVYLPAAYRVCSHCALPAGSRCGTACVSSRCAWQLAPLEFC